MTPDEILKDPDFHALPQSEQLKVLATVDPDFAALPGGEQIKVITSLGKKMTAPLPTAAPPQAAPVDPMAESLGMFQPEAMIPSLETIKNEAPVIGSMATMPFKTSPIMAPISGMSASAAALMAGQGTEPMMQGATPDIMASSVGQFNAPLDAFGLGLGAEAGGQAVMAGAQKIAAPFAKKFAERLASNQGAKVAQEMVESNIPISPSEIQLTKTAKAFQWIADNFMPGNLIANKRREEVSSAILKMRQEFITDTMDLPKFTESIPQAQTKTRELFTQFAEQAGGKETLIPMPETIKFIEANMGKDITMSDQWWMKKFIPWMKKEGDARSIEQINSLHATYNRSWNKLTPAQKELRNGLRESLYKDLAENDLQAGLQLETALKTAQEAAKVPRDITKARWIEQSLLNPATDIIDQAYVFSPAKFKVQVDKNLTKIEQMFGQEGLDIINKFADKLMLAAPDMAKLGKISDATKSMRQLTGLGMLSIPGAIAAGQPGLALGLSVPYGFQTFVAKSLMNPSGWLRKWLTTGFKPPTLLTKEAPKLGILEVGND